MGYGFRVELWGDYALFTRPELKVERVSYDVITPAAARGILESILWKPAIKYVIDKIYVLEPISFTNIRRNEVNSKILASSIKDSIVNPSSSKKLQLITSQDIAQRASTILQKVHYIIEAHFEMTDKAGERDNEAKFSEMITRRLQKGQCYSQPYFGTREFTANFRLYDRNVDIETAYKDEIKDLGLMLYDMEYTKNQIQPTFFRAILNNGVLDLKNCEVFR